MMPNFDKSEFNKLNQLLCDTPLLDDFGNNFRRKPVVKQGSILMKSYQGGCYKMT